MRPIRETHLADVKTTPENNATLHMDATSLQVSADVLRCAIDLQDRVSGSFVERT